MKKIYIAPMTEIIRHDPVCICATSKDPKWIVDNGGDNDEGDINPDKSDDYDPSDPNNW